MDNIKPETMTNEHLIGCLMFYSGTNQVDFVLSIKDELLKRLNKISKAELIDLSSKREALVGS